MSQFSKDGYLLEPDSWTTTLAEQIAESLALQLTTDHWKVIKAARRFYLRTGISPSMRPLVKIVKKEVGEELGSSIALAQLFTPRTTKHVAMLSGIPKPSDCLD